MNNVAHWAAAAVPTGSLGWLVLDRQVEQTNVSAAEQIVTSARR